MLDDSDSICHNLVAHPATHWPDNIPSGVQGMRQAAG